MDSLEDKNKIAFITCIEVALMKRGNVDYTLVLAKLQAQFGCGMYDCLIHPEYLRIVLKQVYKDDDNSVLDEIILETDKLSDIDKIKTDFIKVMIK
jgi:hypothetical protein